ncbi:lantibiotic dehydratase C-terminal domain-containing protein [Kitasatospora sp. NBC_01266]|uniref:lantibiotic dehydratase C-terminal domain-containing protein n=1 Tax=Kitasatospora sp. NBC_01266 TaxID=2903572 RepID=UPI002E2EB3B7|nr:lantibiotic dehydratase C-terminal domain-containing protein [Kitasatospora sp. NBC_01266]
MTDAVLTDRRWVSAHLFTSAPLDLVIPELLPELLAELRDAELIDGFFFLRHWQAGPHLRLRLRIAAPEHIRAIRTGRAVQAVQAALARHGAAQFRRRPSVRPFTEAEYQETAERLSALEPESAALALAPNDSLRFVRYQPEHAKYGTGRALAEVEEHFVRCSELALAALADRWSAADRQAYCFALLVAAGAAARGAPAGTPAARLYQEHRSRLLPVAAAVRGPSDGSPAARWAESVRHLGSQLSCLPGESAPGPNLVGNHCAHLACNRLGVAPAQEALLRELAAFAVAELDGPAHP